MAKRKHKTKKKAVVAGRTEDARMPLSVVEPNAEVIAKSKVSTTSKPHVEPTIAVMTVPTTSNLVEKEDPSAAVFVKPSESFEQVAVPETAVDNEEQQKFELTQSIYEGAKQAWKSGTDIPVVKTMLNTTEAVTGSLVGVTTGKTLDDVLDRGIKPKLAELDYHLNRLLNGGDDCPPLFDDVLDMIAASMLMYPVSSLRVMALHGMIPKEVSEKLQANNHAMLDTPLQPSDMVAYMLRYGVLCGDPALTKPLVDMTVKTFTDERHKCRLAQNGSEIVVMSDKTPNEAVYGILLDEVGKRVLVSFRGTHNIQDALQDLDCQTIRVINPVLESSESSVTFHKSFHDFLFNKDFSSSGMVKYDEIMGRVLKLLNQNKGFKLNVTGYGLGGALATVFAFYASTNANIIRPVVCMPVASPYVGDNSFLQAFKVQEKRGRIKMLRIANDKDVVTFVPAVSVKDSKVQEGSAVAMKHVGIGLTMSKNLKLGLVPFPIPIPFLTHEAGDFVLSYPKEDVESAEVKHDVDNSNVADMILNHLGKEYLYRTELNEGRLKKIKIDDLYADKNLVGGLFSDGVSHE